MDGLGLLQNCQQHNINIEEGHLKTLAMFGLETRLSDLLFKCLQKKKL